MTIRYLTFLAMAFFNNLILAQTFLTQNDAIATTLNNNFGIKIAQKNIDIAANNASKTAVGYNPTLNASAGASTNVGGSSQKFNNGMEANVSNALSLSGNANITGSYTLYDQTRSTALDQLREVVNFANLQLRQAIEINVLQLIAGYYDVARLTSSANVLNQTIFVSNRRLERVKYQYEYGQGVRLDILNAEVDVQRDSINLINTQQQLANAKRDLNVIMGLSVDNPINVDTTVNYKALTLEALRAGMLDKNIEVNLLDKNVNINQYDLRLIEDEKKPRLSASGAYTYSQQKNPSGAFINRSNSRGLNVGLNMAWNLYDGGLRKLRKQNTEISLQSLQLQRDQLIQELERDLINTWENYQNALYVLQAEEINLNTSRLNFDRTEEQFNLGQASSVEFRQAQLNLLSAATNYNNAKFDAKVIEVSLLQLAGQIIP